MAITPVSGNAGKITLGTQTIPITAWTLVGECTVIDVTHTSCGGYGAVYPGITRYSGSATIILDDTTAATILGEIQPENSSLSYIVLYDTASNKFAEFTNTTAAASELALVSSIDISLSVDDVVRVTVNFVINGEAVFTR